MCQGEPTFFSVSHQKCSVCYKFDLKKPLLRRENSVVFATDRWDKYIITNLTCQAFFEKNLDISRFVAHFVVHFAQIYRTEDGFVLLRHKTVLYSIYHYIL